MLIRDLKLFLRSLKAVLIAGLLLIAAFAGAVLALVNSETKSTQIWTLAAYNADLENDMGSMIVNFIGSSSMISSYVSVQFYDTEEAAIQAVEDGAVAALLVPEGFFSSVTYGENKALRMVLNDAAETGKNSILVYSEYGSKLLKDGQVSIYVGDDFLVDQGADETTRDDVNVYLNVVLMDQAAETMTKAFITLEIPYTAQGLGMVQHYVALYLTLLLCLLTLCFFSLYQMDATRPRLLRLRASGITEGRYQLWKILLPALLFLVLLGIAMAVLAQFMTLSFTPVAILGVILAALFISAFCSLLAMGIGGASGAAAFLIFAAGLFFCGGILPYSRLDPAALVVGRFTPTGVMYQLLSPLFGGKFVFSAYPTAVVYLGIAALLAHLRYRRILLGREA